MRACDLCLDFDFPENAVWFETLAPCMGAMSSLRRLTGGLFGVGRCMFWRGALTSLPALPTPPPAPAPAPPACAKANVALPATKAAAMRVLVNFIGDLLSVGLAVPINPLAKRIVPTRPHLGAAFLSRIRLR